MTAKYDWEGLSDGGKMKKSRRVRASPYEGKHRRKKYRAGYNTTPLEELLATRGEGNAKTLAVQRGKTIVTKSNPNDKMRAQTVTASTFDGINILDNLIPYDKNVIKEPDPVSLAAQFGNYQAASVPHGQVHQSKGIITYRPCPF
jgi:hypothetical protein